MSRAIGYSFADLSLITQQLTLKNAVRIMLVLLAIIRPYPAKAAEKDMGSNLLLTQVKTIMI